jgi:hypothetical protein
MELKFFQIPPVIELQNSMKHLFPSASATEISASAAQVQALIQMFRQDLMTGLIDINYLPDKQLIFLFTEGKIATTYLLTSLDWKRLQPLEWNALVSNITGTVRTLQLPREGLRVSKILIESDTPIRTFTTQTSDLKKHVEEWTAYPHNGPIHLRWSQAEAVMLFPGYNPAAQPALFVNNEQAICGTDAFRNILNWHETQCEASVYSGDQASEAFEEYLLQRTFTGTVQKVIRRYNELAGRSLVNALGQEITTAARGQGWHIQSSDGTVTDAEIFSSIQNQASAYRMIAGLCLSRIEDVMGSKITTSIVQETLSQMDPIDQSMMRTHPFLTNASIEPAGGRKS